LAAGLPPVDSARVRLVKRAYEAFAERDVETLRSISDPAIEIITVTGMVAGREDPYRGYDGIRQYIADVVEIWDEIELTPAEFHETAGERILVLGRVRARRAGRLLDLPSTWLWEFRGERVLRAHVFSDPRGAEAFLTEQGDT
jgi:ketosteroid isomerase-like protein